MKENIPCPLCGKRNISFRLQKPERRIVQCKNDGLVFVNPQPTERELDRLYNENYFAVGAKRTDNSLGYYDYLAERPLLLPYFRRKVRQLKSLLPGKKILEIGSGYGFFLEEAKHEGLDVLGIDISRPAVDYAKKQGLSARAIDLFDAKFRHGTFDGVVAFHLIEHVLDPVVFMREVYRITKPGGVILLATPREGGYLSRIMGKNWFSFRHREHLYFFSKETLTALLAKTGFTDIRCFGDETRWYPVHFLLRGATYFSESLLWQKMFRWAEAVFKIFPLSILQVPFPLDTMIVTAKK